MQCSRPIQPRSHPSEYGRIHMLGVALKNPNNHQSPAARTERGGCQPRDFPFFRVFLNVFPPDSKFCLRFQILPSGLKNLPPDSIPDVRIQNLASGFIQNRPRTDFPRLRTYSRRPRTDFPRPRTHFRRPRTDSRRLRTGFPRLRTDSRRPRTHSRRPRTDVPRPRIDIPRHGFRVGWHRQRRQPNQIQTRPAARVAWRCAAISFQWPNAGNALR